MTPALRSSSLYFDIAPGSSAPGISPASDSRLPGTRTMKRIAASSRWVKWTGDTRALPSGSRWQAFVAVGVDDRRDAVWELVGTGCE
jgi:hypothetical protein